MSYVIWRESDTTGETEYFAGFGRGRGGVIHWSARRADAKEYPTQAEAIDARDRITDRVHATPDAP